MTKRKADDGILIWTPTMDDILVDAYLHEHNMDRKIGGSFTSEALSNVVAELQKAFKDKVFDKAKVKNRMKYLKTKFQKAYDLFKGGMSGFGWDSNKSMWIAEPEVWKAFIEAKPEAEKYFNKSIPHYEQMEIMFGNDRANGEFTQTAKEMRMSHSHSSDDGGFDSIEIIDNLVSQNEVSLESFTTAMEDFNAANLAQENQPTNNVISSKGKQKKSRLSNLSNDDRDALVIKEGFDCVVKAIVISSQTLLKVCPQSNMSAKEIWQLVDRFGLEGKVRRNAYVLLVKNPNLLDAVCSAPPEEQKEILLDLLG